MESNKIGNLRQVASMNRYTFTEGKEAGLRVIDCDNGKIRFLLNESKALDVMQMFHNGTNVSFISKNGFTSREIPFNRRFEGGMVYTCGLDNLGRHEGYELHGSFHNTPAKIICAKCDKEGIFVHAKMDVTELFGENLSLTRTIESKANSNVLEITDTLSNLGSKEQEYNILYHVNLGYPMLDEGATIYANDCVVEPTTEWAKEHVESVFYIKEPVPNLKETCYFLYLKQPKVTVENKKINKQFTIEYSNDTLPYFLLWKSLASNDYAIGLEPCTAQIKREMEKKIIKEKETVQFKLKLTVNDI